MAATLALLGTYAAVGVGALLIVSLRTRRRKRRDGQPPTLGQ